MKHLESAKRRKEMERLVWTKISVGGYGTPARMSIREVYNNPPELYELLKSTTFAVPKWDQFSGYYGCASVGRHDVTVIFAEDSLPWKTNDKEEFLDVFKEYFQDERISETNAKTFSIEIDHPDERDQRVPEEIEGYVIALAMSTAANAGMKLAINGHVFCPPERFGEKEEKRESFDRETLAKEGWYP